MKKRVLLIIGLIVLIAGVIISNFAKFPLADVLGYAITMFGAGLAVAGMYEKRDPAVKTWVVWLSIILVGLGAFVLGFAGVAEDKVKTIITAVFGLVVIIAGLIVPVVIPKNKSFVYLTFIKTFCKATQTIYNAIVISKDKISNKKVMWFITTICCYVLCFVVISGICTSYVNSVVKPSETDRIKIERSTKNSLSLGWGLYLGTNTENAGHWNKEDAETYQKYTEFDNQEEAIDYQKEIINERVQVFVEKPWIIPGHLFSKIKGLWGGLFLPFAYEEGNSINSFVLYGMHGLIYKAICAIAYLTFILLCTVILFSHKRHKNCDINTFYSPILQFKMMIIGLTSVLFLFEVMPKYVSHMQIIMFTIGIFCIDSFMDNSKRFHDRILRKKEVNV